MWGLTRKISVAHTALPPVAFHAREEARAHLIPQNIQTLHATDCWLVTIAEHTSNKNLLTAIQAVARHNRAHAQKVFYTLIGDGQLTDELKKYVRAHHLEDSIFFAGYVEDARTYLKAFDCFILPSTKEGFPYALLEAGLARVPIIASDVGGIPELIHEKITGLLVDPHHTASLTEKITYAVEHPEEVRTWAGTLHQKVALDFSIDTMLTKTIRAYTD
jgi:glycosyltransferase involved in cell wall biosynthesis